MSYDNEAIVRRVYYLSEGDHLNMPEVVSMFTDDGVFNDKVAQQSYRGEHIGDVGTNMAKWFPDVHRELYRVTTLGDLVAVELSIQGTHRAPLETPAGILEPTGAKIDAPTGDFWYLRDGQIETFNCYIGYSMMFTQLGAPPDFASAIAASAAAR